MHTVYIKPELSTIVSNKRITIGDICKVYCYEESLAKEVRNLEILRIEKQGKQKISVSALYLVRYISDRKPGILVINLGEVDFLIEYKPPEPEKKWLEILKVGFIGVIIFFGSAFTIMTFNEDVNVAEIFELLYKNIAGMTEGNGWLEVSYAVGLPIGVLLFFNHFASAKLSNDPTPLQIQMRQYEQQEDATIIEDAARKGERLE